MIIRQLTVGPLAENTWLLCDAPSADAVLVDPGDEPERLLEAVDESGCTLRAIWLTHAHFDHVGAVAAILRDRAVPVYLHPLDRGLYDRAHETGLLYGLDIETPPPPDHELTEGGRVQLGTTVFSVWHLPGHAPGHVAFVSDGYCFSGDVLFAGSVGRTDLPLCNPRDMSESLERLTTLPPATRVFPGHGPETTIAAELVGNPFLRGLARPVGTRL